MLKMGFPKLPSQLFDSEKVTDKYLAKNRSGKAEAGFRFHGEHHLPGHRTLQSPGPKGSDSLRNNSPLQLVRTVSSTHWSHTRLHCGQDSLIGNQRPGSCLPQPSQTSQEHQVYCFNYLQVGIQFSAIKAVCNNVQPSPLSMICATSGDAPLFFSSANKSAKEKPVSGQKQEGNKMSGIISSGEEPSDTTTTDIQGRKDDPAGAGKSTHATGSKRPKVSCIWLISLSFPSFCLSETSAIHKRTNSYDDTYMRNLNRQIL